MKRVCARDRGQRQRRAAGGLWTVGYVHTWERPQREADLGGKGALVSAPPPWMHSNAGDSFSRWVTREGVQAGEGARGGGPAHTQPQRSSSRAGGGAQGPAHAGGTRAYGGLVAAAAAVAATALLVAATIAATLGRAVAATTLWGERS